MQQSRRNRVDATIAEQREGIINEYFSNLNDRSNLLEKVLKQDEILITRSSSNLNKCGFEQVDIQEETPVVSKFLSKSSNISETETFIDGKL